MAAEIPKWWTEVEVLLDGATGGMFGDTASAAYFAILGGFDREQVIAAVTSLLAEDRRFPLPSPGAIHERIVCDTTIPSWDRAWPHIKRTLNHHLSGTEDPARINTVLAELEDDHPVLAEFVRVKGARRLMAERTDHEDWGGKVLKDLGVAYGQIVAVHEQRRRDGIVAEYAPALAGPRRSLGREGLAGAMQNLIGGLEPTSHPQIERGNAHGE